MSSTQVERGRLCHDCRESIGTVPDRKARRGMYLCRVCYASRHIVAPPSIPPKRITLHQRIINKVRQDLPQFALGGFMRTVRSLIKDEEAAPEFRHMRCAPDLYCWDGETLTAVEVVDHHDIDEPKMRKYVEIFWALDAEGIPLRLLAINRYWAVGEIPMFALAWGQPIEVSHQPNLRHQFAPLGYCDAPDRR